MLIACTGMPVACSWHARGILAPSSDGGAASFLDALALGRGVGIVFLPIVDGPAACLSNKEPNLQQCLNQRARLALPIRLFLNVIVGEPG